MRLAGVIDGRARAQALRERVARETAELVKTHGVTPGLAVVLVGDDPASQIYVRSKGEQTVAAGMHSVTRRLAGDVSIEAVFAVIAALNADRAIHGILVQLPLPAQLDAAAVIAAIDPGKDVDGLTMINAGRLASGRPVLAPCTPLGCMILLHDTLGDLAGRHAVVVGRSVLVGRPVAQLLLAADCTVTIAHSKTDDLPSVCRLGDILVAAVGRPEMIRGDWIKPGATVIDVGINRVPFRDPVRAAAGHTRVVGDVAYKEAARHAAWITPAPGGVGPMTVACLLQNTLTAARRLSGVEA